VNTRERWLVSALLVLATVAAYLPALGGAFIWDDDSHVTDNLALRSLDGLRTIWLQPGLVPSAERPGVFTPTQYYPLLQTAFWIEYQLWGPRPFGYHLVSVLLHALVALLVWAVLRRLRVPGAPLAAFAFALHPVHVESVAWITEHKNLLAGAFTLGAALCYFRFSPPEEDGPREGARGPYTAALLLYVAAMFSKTVAVTLPAALAVVLWWKRGRLRAADLRALGAMSAAGALLAAMTVAIEKFVAGAGGAEWHLSFAQRILIAGRALCFYAGKLLWPAGQAFVYPQWKVDASQPAQWLFPLGFLAAAFLCWTQRGRWGRGPLAALLLFAGTLLPALGFVDFYTMRFSYVADHYQYLGSVSLLALFAAILAVATAGRIGPALRTAGAAALVLTLGALTWNRAHVFRSNEALWRDTLAKNPECWFALNNLALEVKSTGRVDEAVALLREAVRVRPGYHAGRYNLALALEARGQLEEAARELQVVLGQDQELYADLYYQMGLLRARQGRWDEAIAAHRRSVLMYPERPENRSALAAALANAGHPAEALQTYRDVVARAPHLTDAHYNIGLLLAAQGRTEEARRSLQRALALAEEQGNAPLADWVRGRIAQLPPR